MNYRLILVAEQIINDQLNALLDRISGRGFDDLDAPKLTESGHRAEVLFSSSQSQYQLKESLRAILCETQYNGFVLQQGHNLHPQLLIMDMDSTLVQAETIDQIAAHAGRMTEVSAITESAMRGELDFSQSLTKRVAMLKGLAKGQLEQVHKALPLTSGAEQLIAAANKHNCLTVLVSGGFSYFAEPIAKRIGIDETYANELEFVDERLTGRVVGTIVDAEFKQMTLNRLISERGFDRARTIAIGDGANDLLMLDAAGLGIAFHGKPKVQAQAQAVLNHTGLEALQWLLEW